MTALTDTPNPAGVAGPRAPATEPPAPPRRRGLRGWAAIAVAVVAIVAIGAALAGGDWERKDPLDPDSAGPTGSRALAQVLREHGVRVTVVREHSAALAALRSESATLVMPDSAYLSDETVSVMMDAAADTVVIAPTARSLRLLFPGARPAGVASADPVAPQCDQPDAVRAGPIVPGLVFTTGPATAGCYPSDGAFGLLWLDAADGSRAAAIDARELFTNERIAENGNAALAIGLMGRHPALVWYVPSAADGDIVDATPTLGELTPPWVTPAMTLLVCAAIAAALWRGRRFGPLVAEHLPVTVRASETMEGRARLYRRSGDAGHALDALRAGAIERIARMLGLGPAAAAGDVADATADRLGAPRALVRGILIDTRPDSDTALVAASDRLRDLEAAVRASVRIERNPS